MPTAAVGARPGGRATRLAARAAAPAPGRDRCPPGTTPTRLLRAEGATLDARLSRGPASLLPSSRRPRLPRGGPRRAERGRATGPRPRRPHALEGRQTPTRRSSSAAQAGAPARGRRHASSGSRRSACPRRAARRSPPRSPAPGGAGRARWPVPCVRGARPARQLLLQAPDARDRAPAPDRGRREHRSTRPRRAILAGAPATRRRLCAEALLQRLPDDGERALLARLARRGARVAGPRRSRVAAWRRAARDRRQAQRRVREISQTVDAVARPADRYRADCRPRSMPPSDERLPDPGAMPASAP